MCFQVMKTASLFSRMRPLYDDDDIYDWLNIDWKLRPRIDRVYNSDEFESILPTDNKEAILALDIRCKLFWKFIHKLTYVHVD